MTVDADVEEASGAGAKADSTVSQATAAIVVIAAEVLRAKVADRNGPFLLQALRGAGIDVVECRTIGDDIAAIARAIKRLSGQVSDVFTTGGVGPTHDDVTMAGVARAFDLELVVQPQLMAALAARAAAHPRASPGLMEAYRRMACVPAGAELIWPASPNPPAVRVRNITIMPGPPALVRAAFASIAQRLRGRPWATGSLLLDGDEAPIAATLAAVQSAFADVAIGSYPNVDGGPPRLRLTLDGRDPSRVQAAMCLLRERFPHATEGSDEAPA